MDVQTFDQVVVLGPCPGCQSWQLDYDQILVIGTWLGDHEAFTQAIETILVDHLVECVHLQRAIGNNWVSYV